MIAFLIIVIVCLIGILIGVILYNNNKRAQIFNDEKLRAIDDARSTIQKERDEATRQTALQLQTLHNQIVELQNEKSALLANENIWRNEAEEKKKTILNDAKLKQDEELAKLAEEVELKKTTIEASIAEVQGRLDDLSAIEQAALAMKANEAVTALNNRIKIDEKSLDELKELYDAIRKLHIANPTPLYKAVFDIYIRTPVKDMINCLGVSGKGGIYKITDTVDGRIYIGKTNDFAERWLEHIKRGTGYEIPTVTGSLFYAAMMADGVWNFSFEVVEEIADSDKRTEREKYWINFFGSDTSGLNMRKG
jgi:hypothetical protein